MFRPRASITYSRATSAMRTQAFPKSCRISGSTRSARPINRYWENLFCFMLSPSGTVGHTLAHEPGRPQREHDDEHDESKDVGVVAHQQATGEVTDVARADRLDQAQQNTANHRPRKIADAAKHGSGESLQTGDETPRMLGGADVGCVHHDGKRRKNRTDEKGGR